MPRRAVRPGNELVALNMKVPQDLRSRLEKAAKKSGRSLTSEVGYRVERGFDYEKLFGSEYTQILIRLIADASATPVSDGMRTPGYSKGPYMPSGS